MNHDSQYILASSVLQPIQQVHGCMDIQSLYQPHLGLYSLECEMLKCTVKPVCLLWQLECLKRILTWSEGDRSIVFWHCYLFIASQIACYELCAFWHFCIVYVYIILYMTLYIYLRWHVKALCVAIYVYLYTRALILVWHARPSAVLCLYSIRTITNDL